MSEPKVLIPQGYRIIVNSWENDADNRKTEIVEGLLYNEVKFYAAFCKLHYSRNGRGSKKGFGNILDGDSDEYTKLLNVVEKLLLENKTVAGILLGDPIPNEFETDDDVQEIHYYFHEKLFGSSEHIARVFDSMEVQFFEWDVEGHDVTKEFV